MLTGGGRRLGAALETRLGVRGIHRPGGQRPSGGGGRRRPTVAVPIANGDEILRCIDDVGSRGFARFLLIGSEQATRDTARNYRISLKHAAFLPADSETAACELAANLVSEGRADVLMKGYVHTADFMHAILDREKQLLDNEGLLSHVAVLDVAAYHKLMLVTDAAINVEPDVEQKLAILVNAVSTARSLGVRRPKIAVVAPVEVPSPHIKSTLDAEELKRRWKAGELRPRLGEVDLDGPFGLDVAVSREAAEVKGIDGAVAGDADILLMPNLDSGNALYKSLTHFSGAHVAGVVAGARVPIVLTSRSDSELNRYYSVLLALAGISRRLRSGRAAFRPAERRHLAS